MDTPTTESYLPSRPSALPILDQAGEKTGREPRREAHERAAARPRARRPGEGAYEHHPFEADVHRSEEHTSELQSRQYLVCRLLLVKKKFGLLALINTRCIGNR